MPAEATVKRDESAWFDAARFIALEHEASRQVDLACDTNDPEKVLEHLREYRRLRKLMAAL